MIWLQWLNLHRNLELYRDMNSSETHDQRIANMTFALVYPISGQSGEEGRSEGNLEVIAWLTGFNVQKQQELIKAKVTFKSFFQQAKVKRMLIHHRSDLWLSRRGYSEPVDTTGKDTWINWWMNWQGRKMEKIFTNGWSDPFWSLGRCITSFWELSN